MPACLSPLALKSPARIVPCGKCPYCLQNKRNDWVFRLQQEQKTAKSAVFLTLTYHPKYLSYKDGKAQLNKRHVQLFLKRLRRDIERQIPNQKIRYYCVGEYGGQTGRPHYHLLLFGAPEGYDFTRTWFRGQTHTGNVTASSIAYCTKYVIQNRDHNQRDGRVSPFALMSKRPAIGSMYLTPQMIAWHLEDDRFYAINDGQKISLPRYYRGKIFTKRKQKLHAIKEIRESFDRLRGTLLDLAKRGQKDPLKYYEYQRRRNAQLIKQKVAYTQHI